ncbi:MAG: TonB-dependent receptor [Pseudomonadota bacterium]|jgi:iron complex outermembrane receptor protein|nr:TonB-dependent receptor [Pseudomonadota bacterium]
MFHTRLILATIAAAVSGAALARSARPAPSFAPVTSSPQLQAITITAEKLPERLSQTPVAATVVSGRELAANNAGNIWDLNKLVPSVNINGSFNGRVPMGIRGISSVSNEGTVGLSSGVAIMVDGVPVPSDSMDANNIEDVQSIQVLQGPQATLGGRTAATGLIDIVTRKPTPYFTGDTSLTITNDGEVRLNGFLAGPITRKIDFSLAAWGNRIKYPIRNIELDQSTVQRVSGARVKLLFKPIRNLDITLMGHYGLMTSAGDNFVYKYLSPGAALLVGNHIDPTTGSPVPNVPFMAASTLVPLQPGIGNRYYASPFRANSRIEDRDASLTVSYSTDGLTIGSITAYQHEIQNLNQDLFLVNAYFWNELTGAGSGVAGAPPPFYNHQHINLNINQFSQEFKIASPTGRAFSYLAGLFYSDTKVHQVYNRQLFPAYQNFAVTPDTKTIDVYARTTWRFLPETFLITGLRYNYDSIKYQDYWLLDTLAFPGPGAPYPPVIVSNQSAAGSHYSGTTVGNVSLKEQFTPTVMGYFTYSRGYSPGAFNTVQTLYSASSVTGPTGMTIAQLDGIFPGLISPQNQTKLGYVGKETVNDFELGLKSTFLHHRVRVNVDLFDTKYSNFQIQNFNLSSHAVSPPLILESAGGAETRGAELDTDWAATQSLRVAFAAAYINAKFTKYQDAPCYYPHVTGQQVPGCSYVNGTGVQNLSGRPMPNAPKFKFDTNISDRVPLSVIPYDITMAANYSYQTWTEMLADQNPQAVLPGFGILNLSVGMERDSGAYSVTAFVDNALDKHYAVDMEDFWSSPWGGTNTVVDQPARDSYRYYGLRFTASF